LNREKSKGGEGGEKRAEDKVSFPCHSSISNRYDKKPLAEDRKTTKIS